MTFDLQLVIAIVIAYLLYCVVLASGVQVAINQVKPLFLDPIKAKLTDTQYLVVLYIFRAIITGLAYVYLWGGVEATRATLNGFASSVPDAGIAIVTIAFVVLGEEVLHPLIERAYILRDIAKQLKETTANPPQG